MTDKVVVKNLFKVFGENPEQAIDMVRQGISKADIFEQTGQTVGVMDASFSIKEGEIFVVMGLSGSGKSTLVRLLNRLIEPSAGEVLIDGQNIAAMSDQELRELRRRKMSMVFQSFALMPHLTVLQNAAFGLELAGMDRQERNQRALEALAQVGLDTVHMSYPDQLSGGMQQRVGLARALANNPDVMLMDEAFSALDPLIRTEMQDELVKLQSKSRRTVIFISHDLDEAMRIGDRIAIMEGGRVVQVGTPDEILKNPADDYVRSFFRNVDVTSILSAKDIASKQQATVIKREGFGPTSAIERLRQHERDYGYVVSPDGTFHGVVSIASLLAAEKNNGRLTDAFLNEVEPIHVNTSLSDVIGQVARHAYGLPVIDDNREYQGVITRVAMLRALDREEE
ncbi:glycine betaine/L-proline ABC transporter ATP-binding protein ProV [Marinobacter sp. X15-166B]|uniref:glycine betaine/L-proline ABC transporter ATP-binding protein ProV n=1 Tax=Marinobacter sp. X15-166B TaxID=1897620 RepID=UPI00085C215D|nr:glycine betaine/L-proline ABC transporter ATP-binding protein ProV [Marinobacter sp. X15-166B]OEY66367.1 glycine betaine/L-proline ABC transporter ATP-binding protein [Marinobacter sp. X15-166B]